MGWYPDDPSQTQPFGQGQTNTHNTQGGQGQQENVPGLSLFQKIWTFTVYLSLIGLSIYLAVMAMSSESLILTWIAIVFGCLTGMLIVLRLVRGTVDEARLRFQKKIAATTAEERKERASNRIGRTLFSNEKLIQNVRFHPLSQTVWWIGLAATQGVAFWLLTISDYWPPAVVIVVVIGWLIATVGFGFRLVMWWHDMIYVTNMRILRLEGILTSAVLQMTLNKVTDSGYIEPWHAKLLAWLRIIKAPYGTINLETAGQKQGIEIIHFVPGVEAVYRCISEEALRTV